MSFDDFLADKRTRDAVARNLEIIGEAAGKLDPETREKIPDIDWSGMIGMRNFISHQYFRTDWQIVWETCQHEIESLKVKFEELGFS